MKQLEIKDKIPLFKLNNQFGEEVDIQKYIGKKNLVIYFYPKDNTPGCTAEACSFRDAYEDFSDNNCEVIGISSDNEQSHLNFATKHRLSFQLLSDPNNKVRSLLGAQTNLFGLLPGRVTYVINKQGVICDIFSSQLMILKHISNSLKTLQTIE